MFLPAVAHVEQTGDVRTGVCAYIAAMPLVKKNGYSTTTLSSDIEILNNVTRSATKTDTLERMISFRESKVNVHWETKDSCHQV